MSKLKNTLSMPLADDLHVHLRQDDMMRSVVPLVRPGGVGRCLVMPNTVPPIQTVKDALAYQKQLSALDPELVYLMTLYLTPSLKPETIRDAKKAGLVGVKMYPRGVTTHSDEGVDDLSTFYPVFDAMQDAGLVLDIHGEVPAVPNSEICVLNAEERFLPHLRSLHRDFPDLRIVMEHVTTAAAVDTIMSLGNTVAATITVHHLDMIVDDWAGRNHNFCKPVAKYAHDRAALQYVVRKGHERFFLGSDSAPHPRGAKECADACAGVFTAPLLLAYLADTFDRLGCIDRLADFTSTFGRRFYNLPPHKTTVTLSRKMQTVPECFGTVVPYRAGEALAWTLAD